MRKNDLTEFNEGGTHSENELGGVPIGDNNSVEQDETKLGNFIYSNRIKLTPEIIKQYNLPKSLGNKTVAEATKIIDSKFKDRTDKISISTKDGMLSKIAEAQESLKPINKTIVTLDQNQMFLGGFMQDSTNPYLSNMQPGMDLLEGLTTNNNNQTLNSGIKLGTTVAGTAIGGPIGGMIGSAVGDLAGGLIGSIGQKRREERRGQKNHLINSASNINDFALGGPLDPIEPYDDLINKYRNRNPQLGQSGVILNENDLIERNGYSNPEIAPILNNTGVNQIYPKADLSKLGNVLGQAARYAPIAMNTYQLSQLDKPNYSRLNRIDQRFNPEYVDERSLQNIVSNETNNTINSLSGAVNGSTGALRSNILGAGINRTKALSDAYINAEAQNRANNVQGQQFNLGINQANLSQDNLELDINDRNSAAYRNERSKYLAEIGNGIGDIGREEIYKRIAKTTTGYNWLGEYQRANPNATQEEIEAAAKKAGVLTDSKPNALGGYLFKNKGK